MPPNSRVWARSPSSISARAASLVALLAAATLGAGCGALASATPSVHDPGIVAGQIREVGPLPSRGGMAGWVTVFKPSGQVVAREHMGKADHFRFRFVLPPGRYKLNSGGRLRGDHLPDNCAAIQVRVRSDRTTHVNVHTYCHVI